MDKWWRSRATEALLNVLGGFLRSLFRQGSQRDDKKWEREGGVGKLLDLLAYSGSVSMFPQPIGPTSLRLF